MHVSPFLDRGPDADASSWAGDTSRAPCQVSRISSGLSNRRRIWRGRDPVPLESESLMLPVGTHRRGDEIKVFADQAGIAIDAEDTHDHAKGMSRIVLKVG